MFNARLLELESELLAKEQAERGLPHLLPECVLLLEKIENEVGIRLAARIAADWKGWLSYRRRKESLLICRGRAFSSGGMFPEWRAGFDVPNGLESVREYQRHFDVTPVQDLDHLLINFGAGQTTETAQTTNEAQAIGAARTTFVDQTINVFLWYGENIAPYRLIFESDIREDPEEALQEAITEACVWILTKPKGQTLPEFLSKQHDS